MEWGKRGRGAFHALCMLAFVFFISSGFAKPHEEYLKSATYYSDDWVVNFWNGESDNMDAELAKIREDGFNSIILVIPWREFQPQGMEFAAYPLRRFHLVMDKAASHGLSVLLRVGYSWDYCPEGKSTIDRVNDLPFDAGVRSQWLSYVGRLYKEAARHENFAGGFITWEDFWGFKGKSATFGRKETGISKARQSGYRDFALSHHTIGELRKLYKDDTLTENTIYFPSESSAARAVFYEWYDDFLRRLLKESQGYFPGLSYEIRLDGDEVYTDGVKGWYSHHLSYGAEDADYAAAMYAIQMFAGEGEISVERALEGTKKALEFGRSGGKNLYVEQFLFTDNTPGFEKNGRLSHDAKPEYIRQAAPILSQLSLGYGVWTYRNYGNNKLYNAQFALGQAGWRFAGNARVLERGGSHVAALYEGSSISQNFSADKISADGDTTVIRFQLEGDGKSVVRMYCEGREMHSFVAGQKQYVSHSFRGNVGEVTFSCQKGTAYIDNVNVYTFLTEGDLYKLDGTEDFCAPAIRDLNAALGEGWADSTPAITLLESGSGERETVAYADEASSTGAEGGSAQGGSEVERRAVSAPPAAPNAARGSGPSAGVQSATVRDRSTEGPGW